MIFHRRQDVIKWLTVREVTAACKKALDSGLVRILGGFRPPQDAPYIGVEVSGVHGQKWQIRVRVLEDTVRYRLEYGPPEWQYWEGNEAGLPSVVNGDKPTLYARYAREARHEPTRLHPLDTGTR